MQPNARRSAFLAAVFLAILVAPAATQVAVELGRGERPRCLDLFLRAPSAANLKMFEQDLENGCWIGQQVRPWMQHLQFAILRDAGDKAILGRDGWLFYKPEVQYLIEPPPPSAVEACQGDLVSAVVSFRDQLAARGIRLLVVPAPNKVSVYPEVLARRAEGIKHPVNPETMSVMAQLELAGVEVVNLFEVFERAKDSGKSGTMAPLFLEDEKGGKQNGGKEDGSGLGPYGTRTPLFLAQDTHWSTEGMRLAAQVVAERVVKQGWAARGTIHYGVRPLTIRRHGDLVKMMRFGQFESDFGPEEIACLQVVGPDGEPYRDQADSPILVLGDSFLRIYQRDEPRSAGFIAHLARELGFPLASIVNDGGASTLVRQELCRKPGLLAHKKLVIWEFVERDILFGTEGWQDVPLPAMVPGE